jgi:hypothetical protein
VESLFVAIGLLIVGLALCVRLILPRAVWTEVLGEIIHDGLQGVWHLIFGPRKVRIVGEKERKSTGVLNKRAGSTRNKGDTG